MLSGRPVFASANGRFTLTVRTVSQLDTAAYFQGAPGPIATDLRRSGPALGATAANVDLTHARDLKDGTDFRRARLGLDGTAFGDWDYRILFDFGGSGVENSGQLYETWVQYSGLKPLRFRAGAFSPTIGLEDSASTSGMPFIERSAIEDMARGFAAGDTRLAAQAYAYDAHWLASIAVTGRTIGVINTGTASATPQTFGDQIGIVGRLAFAPFHGDDWRVNIGVHGSYAEPANTAGPGANGATPLSGHVVAFSNTQQLRVDGTKLINTGNIDANHADTVGAEFAVQKGPFIVQSEYENFGVQRTDIASDPHFYGYYVAGLWTITGEPRVYNAATAAFDAPIPAHPFSLSEGTLGAFEIGVRYAEANLNFHPGAFGAAPPANSIRGGDERNVSVDLNWYPNSVIKFMLDYEHVQISRLSPNGAIFQTPVGAQIGQTYNAIAVRSQFAF
jgi:phosphate-selective porin OprO/OprP